MTQTRSLSLGTSFSCSLVLIQCFPFSQWLPTLKPAIFVVILSSPFYGTMSNRVAGLPFLPFEQHMLLYVSLRPLGSLLVFGFSCDASRHI
ncbi:hypothetical protein BD410DRAFT_625142 [Rickenella mellea]|uniref:Uncharacterized protein n=1 Tax=Rickenella mellea TaxID=50990 RepID=A0A4Y7PNK0_9AGAM|nr:hypothetical protein BD410DRAFT_625142 [Rickenella mellea]